ncbi:cyclic AMP receptor A [Labeo rohita]|uniref:Cyclic AMP receptor A n=1 Tax=Labeo rohita TaxID=84645 RepID=A0A498N7Z7_LABRO|nr:cyclic AMP receptor A [Labeo rohita]
MGDEHFLQVNNTSSSRCTFFNTEPDDYRCDVLLKVKRATGTFSIVACSFMLLAIWLLRQSNSLAQKMIRSLTVAALLDSVAYVMGESHPEGSLCNFQAWWLTYFDWAALMWVCLITFNLYLNLVREIRTEHYKILYHVMAWGVPLLMSTLPLMVGYYGPAGAWCWITDNHVGWRFGIWYIPLFSLIVLMICCYARIICVANERCTLAWACKCSGLRQRHLESTEYNRNKAGSYVVRKIRAALTDREQTEQPVRTSCSLAKGKKERYASDAALMNAPEPQGAAGSSASTERAVKQCGS